MARQIIQDRTPRQRAFSDVLAERIGQAAQLGVGAYQQAQQTARQRALQDRQMAMQEAAIEREQQRYDDQLRRQEEARQLQMAQAGYAPTGDFQEDLEGLSKITGIKRKRDERLANLQMQKAEYEAAQRALPPNKRDVYLTKAAEVRLTRNDPSKIKQNQWAAGGFAKRAELAETELKPFEGIGAEYGHGIRSMLPDFMQSEEGRLFEQAQRNFVSAVLRKESGAAISPQEYEQEAKKYFPQVGDSEIVIEQKRRAREQAVENLKAEAGAAYSMIPTIQQQDHFADYKSPRESKKLTSTGFESDYNPANIPSSIGAISTAVANDKTSIILDPQRSAERQKRIQELRAKQGL